MSHPVAIITVPTLNSISLGSWLKLIASSSQASTHEKHSTQASLSMSYRKGTA